MKLETDRASRSRNSDSGMSLLNCGQEAARWCALLLDFYLPDGCGTGYV